MSSAPTVFPLITMLILGTLLLIFGMKYGSAAWQARLRSQPSHDPSLVALKADIAEMKTRLASIETMLREVG